MCRLMEENPPSRVGERGAQEVSPGERESVKRQHELEEAGKSPGSGDASAADSGKPPRDPDSPWLGGG
jgi:hypothetical protein